MKAVMTSKKSTVVSSQAKPLNSHQFMKGGVSKGPYGKPIVVSDDEEEYDDDDEEEEQQEESHDADGDSILGAVDHAESDDDPHSDITHVGFKQSHKKTEGTVEVPPRAGASKKAIDAHDMKSAPKTRDMMQSSTKRPRPPHRDSPQPSIESETSVPVANMTSKKRKRPKERTEMGEAIYGPEDKYFLKETEEQLWNRVVRRGTPPLKGGSGIFSTVSESRTPDPRLLKRKRTEGTLMPSSRKIDKLEARPRIADKIEHPEQDDAESDIEELQRDSQASEALLAMKKMRFEKFQNQRNGASDASANRKQMDLATQNLVGYEGSEEGDEDDEDEGDTPNAMSEDSLRAASQEAHSMAGSEEDMLSEKLVASADIELAQGVNAFAEPSPSSDAPEEPTDTRAGHERVLAKFRQKSKEREKQRPTEKAKQRPFEQEKQRPTESRSTTKRHEANVQPRNAPPASGAPNHGNDKIKTAPKKKKKEKPPPVRFSVHSKPVWKVDDQNGELRVAGPTVKAKEVLTKKAIRQKNIEASRAAAAQEVAQNNVTNHINDLLGTKPEEPKQDEKGEARATSEMENLIPMSIEPEVVVPKRSQRDMQVDDFFRDTASREKSAGETEKLEAGGQGGLKRSRDPARGDLDHERDHELYHSRHFRQGRVSASK